MEEGVEGVYWEAGVEEVAWEIEGVVVEEEEEEEEEDDDDEEEGNEVEENVEGSKETEGLERGWLRWGEAEGVLGRRDGMRVASSSLSSKRSSMARIWFSSLRSSSDDEVGGLGRRKSGSGLDWKKSIIEK